MSGEVMKYFPMVLIVLIFCSKSYAEAELTLEASFQKALQNNQVENIKKARVEQTNESIVQNKSGLYPKISLKGVYTKQENLKDTHYANLNLTHTLFKGGRDLVAIDLAQNSSESATLSGDQEKINLYNSVINLFYNYALSLSEVKNLELLTKQSGERVNEIQRRVAIGRSRMGELLQAKAQMAQANAQLLNAKGSLSEAREKFTTVVGVTDVVPSFDLEMKLNQSNLDQVINQAKNRPDIKLKELKINEANLNLSSARKSHLPTLDLTSNYYLTDRSGTSYSKTKWDAGLVLTLPLFEGFQTDAKVSEAVWKEHEARYNYLDSKKNLESELVSKIETHNRFINQIDSFNEAVSMAKRSYDEALKDYRLGLISNLDVLTALNLYLDTKRNAEKNKIQAIQSEYVLKAAFGVLP
jgi:outer membrane protein